MWKQTIVMMMLLIPLAAAVGQDQVIDEFFQMSDLYSGISQLGTTNSSDNCIGFFCFINYRPSHDNPVISPAPAQATDNLTCIVSGYSDYDSTAPVTNYTRWYINGVFNATSVNLSESLINTNDQIICSKIVSDGEYNSTERNSSQITVGDTIAPTAVAITVSTTSPYTTDADTFSANVTDGGSLVNTDACKFTLKKSDYNSGLDFNLTTNAKTGNTVSITQTMAGYGTGILQFMKSYCSDSSGNVAVNNSVAINITISLYTAPSQGGGGGGDAAQCTVDADCTKYGLSYYCVNTLCVKLDRKDAAYTNLKSLSIDGLSLPEDTIQELLIYGDGFCNWNGACEFNEGENAGNCATQYKIISGKKTAIQGDCSPIALPTDLLTIVIIIAILLVGVLYYARQRRMKR